MKLDEAWIIIRDVCERCGHPEVANLIAVGWSNRMTSSMGSTTKKSSNCLYHVRLSTKLFARALLEEQRNTVAHEVCHVIDGVVNYNLSHGAEWKRLMRQAGYSSERCHTVSTTGLVKRFVYECPNGCQKFKFSTRMHNNVVRGKHRHCRKCKSPITYTGIIE